MKLTASIVIPDGMQPPRTICGWCTVTIFPGNGNPTEAIVMSLCQKCADGIDGEMRLLCIAATYNWLIDGDLGDLFD